MGTYSDTHGAYFGDHELLHYGTNGMRWYHRRYQYPDGSLTPEGRKRYLKDGGKPIDIKTGKVHKDEKSKSSDENISKKLMEKNIKAGKDKAPISAAESLGKDASSIANNAGNLIRAVAKANNKPEPIAMSDEELRRAINRLNMEKQYTELTAAEMDSGLQRAKDILDVISPAVGVAAGAASIAATIYKLKHGSDDDPHYVAIDMDLEVIEHSDTTKAREWLDRNGSKNIKE